MLMEADTRRPKVAQVLGEDARRTGLSERASEPALVGLGAVAN